MSLFHKNYIGTWTTTDTIAAPAIESDMLFVNWGMYP